MGQRYTLVVSDAYGLLRYQTEDVFLCVGLVNGLPDLQFVGRRGLSYSFTGEKLTAEQLTLAFAETRAALGLSGDVYLTCVPSDGADGVPGYCLLGASAGELPLALLAARCEEALAHLNPEYAHKRATGRLAPLRARQVNTEALGERLARHGAGWESQTKFLPLYRCTLESLGL